MKAIARLSDGSISIIGSNVAPDTIHAPEGSVLVEFSPEDETTLTTAGRCRWVFDDVDHPEVGHLEGYEPNPPVPQVLTAYQARTAFRLTPYGNGTLFDAVATLIAGLDDSPKSILIKEAWDKATEYHRDSATIVTLAAALGLTSEQVDEVFREGDKWKA